MFKNSGKRPVAKNYCCVSPLSVVSKIFEEPVYNRLFDHLEKCVYFSDFQYAITSPRSTVDLLTFVSDRLARAFKLSGTT